MRLSGLTLLSLSAIFSVGCASTNLVVDQTLPPPTRQFDRVLVVVSSSDWQWRNDLENEFVKRLGEYGVIASPAHQYWPVGDDGYYSFKDMSDAQSESYRNLRVEAFLWVGTGYMGFSSDGVIVNEYGVTELNKPGASTDLTLVQLGSGKTVWKAQAWTGGDAFSGMGTVRGSLVKEVSKELARTGFIRSSFEECSLDRRTGQRRCPSPPEPQGREGYWLALWGEKEPYQSLSMESTTDGTGLYGLDLSTNISAWLSPLNLPPPGKHMAFIVFDLNRKCPGAPTYASPEAVPGDASIPEMFPIVFFGLGGDLVYDNTPAFSGTARTIDVCGLDKALNAFRLNQGEAGMWVVSR